MATTTATTPILSSVLMERLEKQRIPKSKRKLQKHLRSSGQAYISRTGKLIPAKEVADELCQCPHKCNASVPMEARRRLFDHFYGLGDADMQNCYLRQHMDLRARLNIPEPANIPGTGRPPRRITCKYLVPLLPTTNTVEVCQKAFVSAFVITTKRVRLQREKLISSLGLNSYSSHNRGKNNNNNNINTKDNNNKTPVSIPFWEFFNEKEVSLLKKSLQGPFLPMDLDPSVMIKNEAMKTEEVDISEATLIKEEPKTPMSISFNEFVNEKEISLLKKSLQGPFLPMDLDPSVMIKNKAMKTEEIDISEVTLIKEEPISTRDNNPLIPLGLFLPEGITIVPVATPDHARDIAIVNNFFSNQLWKPEYIGAYS